VEERRRVSEIYTTGGTISDAMAFGHNIAMPSELPSFHLRLSVDLKERLEAVAAENNRSVTAEMTARLERSFELDKVDRGKALQLITEAAQILQKGS
jgi:hypothetical protein